MNLLTPGTGNQLANRNIALQYIVDKIINTESYDMKKGTITSVEGTMFHVSAYAESSAAMISTPNVDKSKNSIYASGLRTLMFRQLKRDPRSFIYEIDPAEIKTDSTSAEWDEIKKSARRMWVCTEEIEKLIFDRRTH
jgi:hypothetical protein